MSTFRHILLLALLIPAVALFGAEDKGKSGIGPGKISLPNGPGSIEGLGSAFEPQLNSGTASYSVSIAVPPGVAGLQPDVTLRYNSGSGNSGSGNKGPAKSGSGSTGWTVYDLSGSGSGRL